MEPGIVSPSTLTYRERLQLGSNDPHTYAQLYSSSRNQNVFSRLTGDATGRFLRSSQGARPSREMPWPEYCNTSEQFWSQGNLSGFITNSTKAVYTHGTFRVGHQPFGDKCDLNRVRPQQLLRFKTKEPYDYMAQIRPDTETTNQTMRMLGTYESDYVAAKRSGNFIPNVCPGGAPWHHPDVKVTGSAAGPGTIPHQFTGRGFSVLGATRRTM